MEFNEKLQELRNRKGITQEELAQKLYVSRAAISKWESGRGYPNIDSLKTLAKFFDMTIDELLSGEELLNLAEEDGKRKEKRFRDLVFGLLDCSVILCFFLPLFGEKASGTIRAVSMLSLAGVAPYLKITYFAVAALTVLTGILILAMQNCQCTFWMRNKVKLSLLLNVLGVLIFIVSLQPYAAAFLFIFMVIKVLVLVNWQ